MNQGSLLLIESPGWTVVYARTAMSAGLWKWPLVTGGVAAKYDALKPLSHQTAVPQRLYSVLKTCQRAVGRREIRIEASNLPVIACTQRLHRVTIASTRRSQSVFIASMTLLQRASSRCRVFTARLRRAHCALTACTHRSHGDHSV